MFKVNGKIFTILFLILGLSAVAAHANVNYESWANVLKTHVNNQGRVNYAALKENSEELAKFIAIVETTDVDSLSKTEQKAFWLNAYNALTVQLIVDKYPLRFGGIRTINFGFPWSIDMDVANDRLSLGDIEHKILRKWDPPDARIHFALNCASIGCPKLPRTPFYPENLDERLDEEARMFLNDPDKNRLDREKGILYHTALFDWFEEDFLAEADDIVSYIKPYLSEADRQYLDNNEVKLKKLKYDWGLNEQE